MAETIDASQLQVLRKFSPFDIMDENLLAQLAEDIDIRSANEGFILFEQGDYDADEFYLISGKITQQAQDGRESVIEAGQSSSRYPVARLRPRMYSAKAASDIRFFTISASVLDELHRSIREQNPGLVMQEMQQRVGEKGHALIYEFQQELKNGRFVLPSLPEVALKIRELMSQQDYDMHDLAKLVNTDPAIATKLVKVSNSVIYRGVQHCDDTHAAIARLGLVTTKQLVTSFAILALFKSDSLHFKDRMKKTWLESVEVAAYSYVLSKNLKGFNPEEALLAGLIHSIGEIVVLTYAERFYDIATNDESLNATVKTLRGPIGEMVLKEWGFAEDLITVARDWDNWNRHSDSDFDYCDLVQVAILYALQTNPEYEQTTEMASAPSLEKLEKLQLCSEQITRIITQAQEQIAELRRLFH